MGAKHANASNNRDVRQNGCQPIARAEFERVLKLLDDRADAINDLRRELHGICRDLADDLRRELQTQFIRMAQLQQEIDALKRNS